MEVLHGIFPKRLECSLFYREGRDESKKAASSATPSGKYELNEGHEALSI